MEREINKARYEKPKLTVIELRADEVLALGCKNDAGGNPGPPTCFGGAINCFETGS